MVNLGLPSINYFYSGTLASGEKMACCTVPRGVIHVSMAVSAHEQSPQGSPELRAQDAKS